MAAHPVVAGSGSALDFAEHVRRAAWQAAGLQPPKPLNTEGPLVPVFVYADSNKEIREQFLWRTAGKLDVGRAAAKFCSEMHLPIALEDFVKDQIEAAARKYMQWKDLGGEKLVDIELYVRRGHYALRDRLSWDVNDPSGNPERYAAVLCGELGLDAAWAAAVAAQLQEQIDDAREAIEAQSGDVVVQPPPNKLRRDTPEPGPCVVQYNPADDPNPARQQRRAQRQAALQQARHQAAGTAASQGAGRAEAIASGSGQQQQQQQQQQQHAGGQPGQSGTLQPALARQGSLASSGHIAAAAGDPAALLAAALGRSGS